MTTQEETIKVCSSVFSPSLSFTDPEENDNVGTCIDLIDNSAHHSNDATEYPLASSSSFSSHLYDTSANSNNLSSIPYTSSSVPSHPSSAVFSPVSFSGAYAQQQRVGMGTSYARNFSTVIDSRKNYFQSAPLLLHQSSSSLPSVSHFSSLYCTFSSPFCSSTSSSFSSSEASSISLSPHSLLVAPHPSVYSSHSFPSSSLSFPFSPVKDFHHFILKQQHNNGFPHHSLNMPPINRNNLNNNGVITPYNNNNNNSALNTKNDMNNIQNGIARRYAYGYQNELDYRTQMFLIAELRKLRHQIIQIQRNMVLHQRMYAAQESRYILSKMNENNERGGAIIIQNKTEVAAQAEAQKQTSKNSLKKFQDKNYFFSLYSPDWIVNFLTNPLNKVLFVIGIGIGCYILKEHWTNSWKNAQLQRRVDSNILLRSVNMLEQAIRGAPKFSYMS